MGVFRTKFVTENVEKRRETSRKGEKRRERGREREREREREGEAQNTTLHDKFSIFVTEVVRNTSILALSSTVVNFKHIFKIF